MWFIKKPIAFFVLLSIVSGGVILTTLKKAQAFDCETDLTLSSSADQKRICEQEVLNLEQDIRNLQVQLEKQKTQTGSIKKDVQFLTTQIEQAKLKIKLRNNAIAKLTQEIKVKNKTIDTLETKIDKKKASLAELIRKTDEIDKIPFLSVVLQNKSVSDVYSDMSTFASIKREVKENVEGIKVAKTSTEKEKKTLQQKQEQEVDAKVELENSKKVVEKSETEKKVLLKLSQQEENKQSAYIAAREKKRATIRARLFQLAGGNAAIPFGDALVYAQEAGKKTSVDPAFILAILQQESNLGANVGSCYLSDQVTGAGTVIKSGAAIKNVMKPNRDVKPFLDIVGKLGLDPFKTRVSCPLAGGGYGGAMGPSQFIPSTWVMMENKVAKALGISGEPNPWIPRDAFMASGVFLADLGASSGGYTAERNAACRYYSGRACDSKRPANSFYGNQVMARKKTIQETMIDPLQNP